MEMRLLFASNHMGNYDLYRFSLSDGEIGKITTSSGSESSPGYSPNSTLLVFDSNRDGNYEIYYLDLTSLAVTRLTDNLMFDGSPDWRLYLPAGETSIPDCSTYVIRWGES